MIHFHKIQKKKKNFPGTIQKIGKKKMGAQFPNKIFISTVITRGASEKKRNGFNGSEKVSKAGRGAFNGRGASFPFEPHQPLRPNGSE